MASHYLLIDFHMDLMLLYLIYKILGKVNCVPHYFFQSQFRARQIIRLVTYIENSK